MPWQSEMLLREDDKTLVLPAGNSQRLLHGGQVLLNACGYNGGSAFESLHI